VDHVTDDGLSATVVFSQPEIGTVGLTEAEARAQFSRVDIHKADFRPIKARCPAATPAR
jgi:glutathione reductase (NADPH)